MAEGDDRMAEVRRLEEEMWALRQEQRLLGDRIAGLDKRLDELVRLAKAEVRGGKRRKG